MNKKKLSVAILGSRGIPNRYGGFEACAEELGIRLARKGHRVVVYTTSDHPEKAASWNGVIRIMKWNPENIFGTFGQFVYDLVCNLHSRKAGFDVILHLGYTSDSVWHWLWTGRSCHIVNMDGQEWKRQKYNRMVRGFLKRAEMLATLRSDWLVADSPVIAQYLSEKYRAPVRYIAYGARIPESYDEDLVRLMGLAPLGYDLLVARMEPENNIELAIRAKLGSSDPMPLVIVGNDNRYRRRLMAIYAHRDRILFKDAIYDERKIDSLRHFSRLYLHGHSVGGTNPSLLEAMACRCRIVAHRNPFNEHVLGEDALYFSSEDELRNHFDAPMPGIFTAFVRNNLDKIRRDYNWAVVTDAYESLFYEAKDLR